jgi:hypothetical protein
MAAVIFKKEDKMSKNVENILKAFVSLSNTEKNQLLSIIQEVGLGGENRTRQIFESFGLESLSTTVNFAPTPGACPACGK